MRNRKIRFRMVDDIPLNYKIILIYLIGVLLPIIVINLISMDRMSELITDREEQNLQISLERARKDIHDYIDGGVAISHALKTDKELYEILDKTYEDQVEFYKIFDEQLRNRVTSYIPLNNQILRINAFTENPTIISGGNYHIIDNEVRNSAWFKLWSTSSEPVLVAAYRAPEATNRNFMIPYLSVMEKMDYYDTNNKYTKLLRIDIDISKIYDVIVRERDYFNLYLVNENGEVILSEETGYQWGVTGAYSPFELAEEDKNDVHEVSIGTARYVKGWKLIGIPQRTRLNDAMEGMYYSFGLLAVIISLFTAVFVFILLRSYNYRVKRLSRHMQKVTNEKFDLIRIDEGRDEIGGLIQNFNIMTARMNSLINNVYKLEIQKKNLEMEQVRAELNFLQSQMNPHFLFNTLNAMLVVSAKNGYTEITDIIKNLSRLLRRLLSWKDDLVTLEEEIKFTEMYLQIEKFRFRDKFDYCLEIDPEALQFKIPKMTIQPLVENACKHGIQTTEGLGVIHIKVTATDSRLCISVTDNGIGIEASRLREIILSIRNENNSGNNIGIRNVYRRLELYYDDLVRFDISSHSNQGTEVSFEIPVRLLTRHIPPEGGPGKE